MKSIRTAAILVALATSACSPGTVAPSAVRSSHLAATILPTTDAGTTFSSSIYPYVIRLPWRWQGGVRSSGSGEDFFYGPQEMTLTIGSGHPEPGQTVEDRVAANRLEFLDCTTDPADDVPIMLGREPGILWSIKCGPTLSLAANTIHNDVGYRLMVKLPDSAQAMAQATALMDGFLSSFAFTD
jgi:hypothetical protein